MLIAGYRQTDVIYANADTVVAAAVAPDGERVVLKYPDSEQPAPELLARWRHEFHTLQSIDSEWVVKARALHQDGRKLVLAMEAFATSSLAQLIEGQHLDLGEKLGLALQLCRALSDVHAHRLIHGDVAPKNVLVDLRQMRLKLCDFALSSPLDREEAPPGPGLRGTLDYISPEQTGRTSLEVDYRSDFYSLGITLYELFAGRRPFLLSDPMALLHAQLAVMPTPLHLLDESIPAPLSRVVQKLLAKYPDERYQSSYGLLEDLEQCARDWAHRRHIDDFELGRHDTPERFCIAQKLYGREAEAAAMLEAFERAAAGRAELLLVSGASGIGKTALVAELHRPVLARRGYFLRGKCDQYRRNEPYAALCQAFQPFVELLASEGEERRSYWRDTLRLALGDTAGTVAALLPQLSLLIGEIPALPALPAAENEQRFHFAFAAFTRALADSAHPIALFLDDLQWVDGPSLRLLQHLLADPEGHCCLLVVGAFRDQEVDDGHPLQQMLLSLRQAGVPAPGRLHLDHLQSEHVSQLIADSLHSKPEDIEALAELCVEKTRGNPFFLNQFLRRLHALGDLRYERRSGRWAWDMTRIRQRDMTDNVVTLMLDGMRGLAPLTQRLLANAAHLGESFSLSELMAVSDLDADACARALWPALQASLVLPLDEGYKFTGTPALLAEARYRFLHDRVQQAAHDLTPLHDLAALQLRCGRRLLAASNEAQREQRLFSILACLNAGRGLMHEPQELATLRRLNLRAGLRAKAASAHATAVDFLRHAHALLPEDAWEQDPDGTLALYRELSEAEYLAGNFNAAERLYPLAQAACPSGDGRALLGLVQAEQYHIQGRFGDAFTVLLKALEEIGRPFPATEEAAQALFPDEFAATEQQLADQGEDAILRAPEMQDPRALLEMRLCMALSYASYQTSRFAAFVLNTCRMMSTTLAHGQSDLSCIAYVAHMTSRSVMQRPYTECYALGHLARLLAERRGAAYFRITVYQYFSAFYQHWCEPLSAAIRQVELGWELGQSGTNPLAAGYCALLSAVNHFALGTPLDELEVHCERGIKFLNRTRQPATESMLRHGVLQPLLALTGRTLSPLSFDTEACRASALLEAQPLQPSIPLALMVAARLRHSYLLRDAEGWRQALPLLPMVALCLPDSPSLVESSFYSALGHLRSGFPTDDTAIDTARQLLTRFETWARHGETNFLHKQLLIAAELARAEGRDEAAMAFYSQAVEQAQASGFAPCAALANELYADYWTAKAQPQLARNFIREAHYHYRQWGAVVKCRQLEAQWPGLAFSSARGPQGSQSRSSPTYRDSLDQISRLDLHSLLKANQLLTQEIQLDALLPQMLGVLLENAGAERGAIVLEDEGRLIVEVVGGVDEHHRLVSSRIARPLDEVNRGSEALLPSSLIEFTKLSRRTQRLNRPAEDERFAQSRYLRQCQPKSVLCLPVLNQGKLAAVIYLESRQLENAFTPRHQQTLELLSSQAAISLANARLYEQLEEKVERRTQELRQMSMRDGLTGIANRRAFDERLAIEWRRSQRHGTPLSLLMLDIDHFKQFNDHYGHLEGDRCIKTVAQLLQGVASRGSDLVARYGGEEFALLLPDTEAPAAERLAQACLDAIEALAIPHAKSAAGPHVSLSLGCSTLQASEASTPEMLLSHADQALYRAKRGGRRRWTRFDPQI
ncbi:diguanylate cyclase [Pelomonas sp. APW6]|uniref:Diguanylate cyclase n=1 Tax=Roseateles subflavus TaxID=3053353 RepID=A0ABT7LRL1_9BURK|nr:diguanylate cyclase [Pelomonas sp. APW6]MDL5034106.1 diguanylate cyclase [Pelomonas sp. APW6]